MRQPWDCVWNPKSVPETGARVAAAGARGLRAATNATPPCKSLSHVPCAGLAREGPRTPAQEETARETHARPSTCPADLETPCSDKEMCRFLSGWESLPGAKLSHVE